MLSLEQRYNSLGLLVLHFLPYFEGMVSPQSSKCYWRILPQAPFDGNFAICL